MSLSEVTDLEEEPDRRPILVVDDEQSMREFLSIMLEKEGYEVVTEDRGEKAIERIEDGERFRLVITDLKMPGEDGLDVLEASKAADPACQVVIITAHATPESAISALKSGAYDYIQKPFKVEQAKAVVERALEKYDLKSENLYLRRALANKEQFGDIIGQSEPMQKVFNMISQVAPTPSTVLITGDSGTGKELVAKAIHRRSNVADGPFRPISCGAIPETLIESELFGHRKGAFTGAEEDKEGIFQAAEGGTVFLDEIGELNEATQVKLLRVLQERKVKPVGSNEELDVDCRILAATNRDLREEVEAGNFREDLFFRLNVIPIELPPLRQRRSDIPLLARHFVEKISESMNKEIEGISAEVKRALLNYSFPGNVRELENLMQRAVTLTQDSLIGMDVMPSHLQQDSFDEITQDLDVPEDGVDLESMVEQLECRLITKALEQTDGVKKKAAEKLGISFRSFRYRLDKYDIED
jgi:two-component system response regulator PilR (NtrC family)